MSVTASFYKLSKRKNSTKQPTGTGTVFNVDLKSGTSFLSPTLLLNNSGKPDFNYFSFEGMYYFIKDIVSVRNDLWEIYGIVDSLATAKTDILASTQYVCYSSLSGGTWLPDTRIPVLKSTTTSRATASLASLFNPNGFYVLTATGKDGCHSYACDESHLSQLLDHINDWSDDLINDILAGYYPWTDPNNPQTAVVYDFANDPSGSLAKMNMLTGFCGNAYSQAPSCIRSCIWVPFFASSFASGGAQVFLGSFDCQLSPQPFKLKGEAVTGSTSVNIPWVHTGWRRMYDDVYLYLPLAGMIKLSADSLTNVSSLTINYSATATDGVVAYEVKAGGNIIATLGGQCSANYPIGINQQASAGEIMQSIISGTEKMVNAGINSSISPISMASAGLGVALEGMAATYNTIDVENTTHASTIGGVGGGAGAGLDLNIQCYVVSHDTVINPSDMIATMGVPTMAPTLLSGLNGFCQCANAHVEADLPSPMLDAIDNYLNTGFFIE